MLAMAEGFILLAFKQSVKKKTEEDEETKKTETWVIDRAYSVLICKCMVRDLLRKQVRQWSIPNNIGRTIPAIFLRDTEGDPERAK